MTGWHARVETMPLGRRRIARRYKLAAGLVCFGELLPGKAENIKERSCSSWQREPDVNSAVLKQAFYSAWIFFGGGAGERSNCLHSLRRRGQTQVPTEK